MLANLLDVWILARVVQAACTASLIGLGTVLGLHIALKWRPGQSSEAQLALERRAELVASVIRVSLLFEVLGLALSLLMLDHLVGAIRGAMCAFGVLASTRTGYVGLACTAVTAVACALWVVLHQFDLKLEQPVLTRRKFLALLVLGPLALMDLALVFRFACELDFKVIASCCSVWLDDAAVNTRAAQWGMSPNLAGTLGLAAAGSALLAAVVLWRHPRRITAFALAVSSAVAPLAVLPAILGVVAPYALATPGHLCPFCLFHVQGGYLGWPLFSAIFVASVAGMGSGVVELNRAVIGNPAPAQALQRTLGKWSALAWACALGWALTPIAWYLFRSRGVSVFGRL